MNGTQNFVKSTSGFFCMVWVPTNLHFTPDMTDDGHIECNMAKELEPQVKQNKHVSLEMDLMEPRISSNQLVVFLYGSGSDHHPFHTGHDR